MENKITFEDIVKANSTISTTNIKGKEYAEVNQRIKAFRMVYPCGGIITEMIGNDGKICIFKATITDQNGIVLGTGTAFEKQDSSFINKTSYIENCETSAVGRALGMCGFGIDTSVASYEEVSNAIKQQEEWQDQREIFIKVCKDNGIDAIKYAQEHGINKQTTQDEYIKHIEDIKNADNG